MTRRDANDMTVIAGVGALIIWVICLLAIILKCTSFQVGQQIRLKHLGDDLYEVVSVEAVAADSVEISWHLGTESDLGGYKVSIWGLEPRLIDVGLSNELTLKMAMPDSVGIRAYNKWGLSEYTKWRK